MIRAADVLNATDSVMLRPWDWPRGHHCLGDAAAIVVAMGGPDVMARLRGQYRSALGALRIVRRAGGLADLLAAECRAAGMRLGAAVPGALATTKGQATPAVVVCIEPGQWVGKTRDGYAVVSANLEGWAWRF
jgi:hypothetical protein